MATTRGRAYRRAQDARAYARADHLIRTILGHRSDTSDDVALGEDAVARLVRMYSVDRTHGRGCRYDSDAHRPPVRRADLNAADQLTL
jgi:hypothetical protein